MKRKFWRQLVDWACYPALLLMVAAAAALVWMTQGDRVVSEPVLLLVVMGFSIGGIVLVAAAFLQAPIHGVISARVPGHIPDKMAASAATDGAAGGHEAELAEIAVLAWKIHRRAEMEPNPSKPILRNSCRIMELLQELKVEIISYRDRKIDAGTRVQILEGVEGEEDRVVAEHEPEIQVHGRLTRKAVVSVGTGKNESVAEERSSGAV